VVAVAASIVVACGSATRSSDAEFAKSAAAILLDAQNDYHHSALVHLRCAIAAPGGGYLVDLTATPSGDGRFVMTQAGRTSAFLEMTIAAGNEYLYKASGAPTFSASQRLPAADYSKWVSLGALRGGTALELINSILRLATNSAQVFDQTAPITKGNTETVRGRRAIDIHWQNNSGVEITMAVDDTGRLLEWRGTTPNGTPTFSVEVFTDLAASSVTPPPSPLHYVPGR
jgi:hypothetical protein